MQTDDSLRTPDQSPETFQDTPSAEGRDTPAEAGKAGRQPPHDVSHFSRALAADRDDELTCRECRDLLPDYLSAYTSDEAGAGELPGVALHLATCPACAAEYAELQAIYRLAEEEAGGEPEHYPAPQLGFLSAFALPAQQPPVPRWRLDDLGRLLISMGADLLQAGRPLPRPQVLGVKSGAASAGEVRLEVSDALPDFTIAITVDQSPGEGLTLLIDTSIPSRNGWPNLGGTRVTLIASGQLLASHVTDAYGKVAFSDLDAHTVSELVLEITPAG